jgi:hypothetical protein
MAPNLMTEIPQPAETSEKNPKFVSGVAKSPSLF